jgi:hypothetical protein
VPNTLKLFLKTPSGSSFLSAAIAALLWIFISFATGATVLFSVGGGVVLGVFVFIVGYGLRRLAVAHWKPSS